MVTEEKRDSGPSGDFAEQLRKQAEKKVGPEQTEPKEALSPEEAQRLIRELRVHQVELEMQNEELRRVQVELEASRAHYFDFYDLAQVGYCTLSENGFILEVNLAAATLLGMTRGDLLKQPISRFILLEDQPSYYQHRKRLIETGNFQACELRLVKKDGAMFWARLDAMTVQGADSDPVFRLVISDITERKKTEEILRAAFIYSRNLIETSLDPLVTISAEGKITDVNTSTEKITGISRETLIGSDFANYFTEPEMARAGYLKVFEQGQVRDYPLAIRHTTGAITEVLYNASVYRNEHGEVLGVFAAARDITALRRAEEEVLNRQLQKLASLDRMAGAIAHHFNNQLQAVSGNLELALDSLPLNAERTRAYLNNAMRAGNRASEVSSRMLTYLGQATGKREVLDLSEICRRNLPLLMVSLPKNVFLETNLPSSGPFVSANEIHLHQILGNLVTNSWEACDRGQSVIHVSVKTALPSDISELHRFPVNSPAQSRECACLEVKDTGNGISPKDMDNIFDPFFSNKSIGRGLGLAVVLGIVRTHGGTLTVESKPGCGSIFRIYFPLAEEKICLPQKHEATSPKIQEGGAVLVVEDEEMIRDLTAMMLINMGYTVFTAKDGVEAVEVFKQHLGEILFVLSDLSMPRMNGWETLMALRRLAPGIPVILASGYSEAQVMGEEHPERPQAFLSKPYRRVHLVEAIRRALSDARGH
ncbi:MAG: PAS domain S-box protein [Candidatus Ozemobacteraceae bacterium]